jgi:glyoxylase-like metal-dependent hydrolase (beta-lactamase superfamily II)
VLVDALLTAGQAADLTEWVAAHGKNLTAIYITHGHGDHWFGLGAVLDRFPNARAVALPAVIEQMRSGSTPELLESFWKPRFDGKLPTDLVLAEPLEDHTIELEGRELVAVELGHTDTNQTTCLHVPTWARRRGDPPTTTFTSISPSPTHRDDVNGSPHSTRSSLYTRRP